jgi:hypothetical protein
VSKVPTIFLNRRIVSCLVFSPTEYRIVSDEMPTITPSIMKKVRNRRRDTLRVANLTPPMIPI